MSQAVDAIFENGVFKLLQTPETPLAEGQRVRLVIETPSNADEDLIEFFKRCKKRGNQNR